MPKQDDDKSVSRKKTPANMDEAVDILYANTLELIQAQRPDGRAPTRSENAEDARLAGALTNIGLKIAMAMMKPTSHPTRKVGPVTNSKPASESPAPGKNN